MALIIVSVIMAALAPVITKKLSNAGVTIVGGGSGGGNATPSEPVGSVCGAGAFKPTGEEECKSCQFVTPYCITCADGEGTCTKCDNDHTLTADKQCKENSQCGDKAIEVMIDGEKYCYTKYNVGNSTSTGGLEIDAPPDAVKMVTADGSTSCSGKCCWKGTTSTTCNSTNGSYSGCTRTLCNFAAANTICDNLILNGFSDWTLPTQYQQKIITQGTYSIGLGDDGAQFCDKEANYNSSQCSSRSGYCVGGVSNNCWPFYVWLSNKYAYYLNKGSYSVGDYTTSDGQKQAFSVRCIRKVGADEGATACTPGTFKTSNMCKPCSDKTPNCKNCNSATGTCTQCKSGYELIGGKCEPTGCGEHAVKVNISGDNYCMTKFNIGDNGLGIPDGTAKIVPADGTTSCSGKCCWNSTTSSTCDENAYATSYSDADKYSSCTRTLCNFAAASQICNNLVYNGHDDWELPSTAQLNALDYSEYTVNKGTEGLMLCDASANAGSPQCSSRSGYCVGGVSNNCWPSYIWASNKYAYHLSSGTKKSGDYSSTDGQKQAFSVRCIRKMGANDGATTCKKGEYNDNGSCKACSNKTPNCKYCNSVSGACSACIDGYSLVGSECKPTGCGEHAVKIAIDGANYCMMKYNIGDGGINIPSGSVNIAIAGATAENGGKCSTNCCWQGTTSVDCDDNFDSYSGCSRTTCNFIGANSACDNLVYMGYDDWRLPTHYELNSIDYAAYSIGHNSEGLMFCDTSFGYQSPQCKNADRCLGAASHCHPQYVWTTGAFAHYLSSGAHKSGDYSASADQKHAFSTRCIRKMSPSEGLTNCEKGKYLAEGSCVSCEAKTPNCKTCDTANGGCTTCKEGYELNGNQCVLSGCGTKAVKVIIDNEKYCITKYNIGDNGLDIPSGSATLVAAGGSSCSGKCCWNNRTATYCDDYNTNYNSCTRTQCNFAGASSVCDNLIYNGHDDWSLPTLEQLQKLNVKTYSIGKGQEGLMLCDGTASYDSPRCSNRQYCNGANENWCHGYFIWASNKWAYSLSSGNWKSGDYTASASQKYAFSVRCIRKIGENEGTSECGVGYFLNGATCDECRSRTQNCANCNSSTGVCSMCDDGYELTASGTCELTGCGAKAIKFKIDNEDYCMTKFNIGNSTVNENEIQIPATAGVNVATAGASATDGGKCTGNCCWAGTTSSTCTSNSSYSGCTRTVCNFAAAKLLCDNLVYNGFDDWVLPTNYQMTSIDWSLYSINRDRDGLMFCDAGANAGSTQCSSRGSGCLGSNGDACYPNYVWTDTAYAYYLSAGSKRSGAYNASDTKKHAFSVRCIRKKT